VPSPHTVSKGRMKIKDNKPERAIQVHDLHYIHITFDNTITITAKTYTNQIWHNELCGRYNYLFQILSRSVKGFPSWEGPKLGFHIDFSSRPYNRSVTVTEALVLRPLPRAHHRDTISIPYYTILPWTPIWCYYLGLHDPACEYTIKKHQHVRRGTAPRLVRHYLAPLAPPT